MGEVQILASTYMDKVTVYRNETVIDPETEESREQEIQIYERKACALSSPQNDVPARGSVTFQKEEGYVLFTMPDVRMEANDRVIIETEAGETYRGRTGRTLVYAHSHGETKVLMEGIA